MKRQLPLAAILIVVFAGFAFAQEPTASPMPKPQLTRGQALRQLSSLETKLWEGWKNKDMKPFRSYIAADAVMIGDSGTANKDQALEDLSAPCEVRSYSLSNMDISKISAGTYLLTYKAAQDATCGGTAIPPTIWASSVWVMRNGRWRVFSHQETPAR